MFTPLEISCRGFVITSRLFRPRGAVRCPPKTVSDFNEIFNTTPAQHDNQKCLRVAIIGEPNVGKSTLVNRLMQHRLCSVSKKAHTTRKNTRCVLIENNTQIIFVDTPGVVNAKHAKKHKLESEMIIEPQNAVKSKPDVVGVVVDASNRLAKESFTSRVINLLKSTPDSRHVLLLNKIDRLKSKSELLEIIHLLTDGVVDGQSTFRQKRWPNRDEKLVRWKTEAESCNPVTEEEEDLNLEADLALRQPLTWNRFERVFLLSALHDDGVEDLKQYLLNAAKTSKWAYNEQVITDQNPHEMALMCVREKLLDFLDKETPFNLDLKIHMWDIDAAGTLHVAVLIEAGADRHLKAVLGNDGKMIKRIAKAARQELCNIFSCDVALKLLAGKRE